MSFGDTITTKLRWLYFFCTRNGLFILIANFPILYSSLSSSSLFENSLFKATTFEQHLAIISFTSLNFISYFLSITMLLAICLIGLVCLPKKLFQPIALLSFSSLLFLLILDQVIFRVYKLHLNITLLKMMLTPSFFSLSMLEVLAITTIFILILII